GLLALPHALSYAAAHIGDVFYREVLGAALARFDTGYFVFYGMMCAITLYAMLERVTPVPRKLMALGAAPFLPLATLVVPAAGFFVVVWLLDANRALFLALNAIGRATSDWLWANLTVLGDTIVAFALCLPLWRRRPEALWAFLFVALLGTAWVDGLKPFIDIDRPPAVLGDTVHVIGPAYNHHTFPSGHATAAFAIGGLYAFGSGSRPVAALALAVALLAALSRAVVGVHWPLDILAGALGGWLAALIAAALAHR